MKEKLNSSVPCAQKVVHRFANVAKVENILKADVGTHLWLPRILLFYNLDRNSRLKVTWLTMGN